MRLADIMNKKVESVRVTQSADVAWERMREKKIRHLVVLRGRDVVGVITDRDLGGARGRRTREGQTVSDLMVKKPLVVKSTLTIRQAANRMRNRSIGCLPIVDDGRLKGIITIADLLDVIGRGLEKPLRPRDRAQGRRNPTAWGYPRGRNRPARSGARATSST